jgi:hypothetical protein
VLLHSANIIVAATVSHDATTQVATLTLSTPLSASTTYKRNDCVPEFQLQLAQRSG